MKVLHINWQIWGQDFKGGHVAHVEALINGLSMIAGVEQAYLYTSERKDNDPESLVEYDQSGIRIYEIKNNPINSSFDTPTNDLNNETLEALVADVLKVFKPDVVHVHHLIQFPLSIIDLINYKYNLPIIWTVRDYWYPCKVWNLVNQQHSLCNIDNNCYDCPGCISAKSGVNHATIVASTSHGELVTRKYRYLKALNGVGKVTFVSDYLLAEYKKIGFLGNNAIVRSAGVPFREPAAKENFNVTKNVTFLGYFSAYKGGHFVLECLKGWKGQHFNIHIWGGLDAPSFVEEITPQIPGVTITYHGTYEREDLPHILKDTDLGIVPSVWPDTAPQVIFDFLSAKIPVLGANIGGIPEYVHDGINGLLFEAGNAKSFLHCLEKLISNTDVLCTLSKCIVHPKGVQQYATEIHSLYQEITSRSGSCISLSTSTFMPLGLLKLWAFNWRLRKLFKACKSGDRLDTFIEDQRHGTNSDQKEGYRSDKILRAVKDAYTRAGFNDVVEVIGNDSDTQRNFIRGRKNLRIGVFPLGNSDVASSRVRIYNPLPRLELDGFTVDMKIQSCDLDNCDIIIAQKRCDDFLFRTRVPIILDIDDNYFEHGTSVSRFIKLAKLASAVTVSSDALFKIASKHNTNVHVIPTGIDVHSVPLHREKNNDINHPRKIVWVGFPENLHYITKLFPILRKHHLTLRIISRADTSVVSTVKENADILEFFPWELNTVDRLISECSLGIAPLHSDSWSQAKSAYKVLKYLSLGLDVVCDYSEEYDKINRQLSGQIIAYDLSSWENKILSVDPIDKEQVRRVLINHSSKHIASLWKEVIEKVLATKR